MFVQSAFTGIPTMAAFYLESLGCLILLILSYQTPPPRYENWDQCVDVRGCAWMCMEDSKETALLVAQQVGIAKENVCASLKPERKLI